MLLAGNHVGENAQRRTSVTIATSVVIYLRHYFLKGFQKLTHECPVYRVKVSTNRWALNLTFLIEMVEQILHTKPATIYVSQVIKVYLLFNRVLVFTPTGTVMLSLYQEVNSHDVSSRPYVYIYSRRTHVPSVITFSYVDSDQSRPMSHQVIGP